MNLITTSGSLPSFENVLALIGKKALLPPLNLITVAAILPQTWEFKLVDRNVRDITQAEWDWAECVLISGMIVKSQTCWPVYERRNAGVSRWRLTNDQ